MKPTVGLALLLLGLSACSDKNAQMREEAIAGCAQTGAPKPVCSCVFKTLEKKYDWSQLGALTQRDGKPSEALMRDLVGASMQCAKN